MLRRTLFDDPAEELFERRTRRGILLGDDFELPPEHEAQDAVLIAEIGLNGDMNAVQRPRPTSGLAARTMWSSSSAAIWSRTRLPLGPSATM